MIVSFTITFSFYSTPVLECKPENRSTRGPGGRPAPLLRSRTLPAIVAPGLNILQAQIDARYNGKYKYNNIFFFFPPLTLYFSYKYCRIIVVSIHFLRQCFLCNIYFLSFSFFLVLPAASPLRFKYAVISKCLSFIFPLLVICF